MKKFIKKFKNILITSGASFIGSNLALKLITKVYKITVLDNLSEHIHAKDAFNTSSLYKRICNKVTFKKGSVRILLIALFF